MKQRVKIGIIGDFNHGYHSHTATNETISQLSYSLAGTSEQIEIQEGTLAHQVYGKRKTLEKYSCNFSLNPEYQEQIHQGNLKIVGRNETGAVRKIELKGQRFFMASLFLPQMSSTAENPHPMIMGYLEAALKSKRNLTTRP